MLTTHEVISWLSDDELRKISSSRYWNDEEIEKKKEWFIPDSGNEKISSYLDHETTFRKQLESVLCFARSNNLEVKGVGVDIAAGVGWATAILSKLEFLDKIYALEISKHRLVKIAPRVFDIFGADCRKIIRVLGSFYDIRVPDGSVDFCFMAQAFHHASDPQKLLSEVHRILKPSGFILIMGEEPISSIDLFVKYIKNVAKICLPDSMYRGAPVYKAFPSFRELYPLDKESGDCCYRIKDYKNIFKAAGFLLHQNKKRCFTTFLAVKR